ncbi:MAG: 16S rRNA (cytosine(1402)-N(4))-methyltransferase, partial [Haemophilus parainfluenzae]
MEHIPVLGEEAVNALAIQRDSIYVDATFGRGGHARRILAQLGEKGKLYAFDKDPEAVAAGKQLEQQDQRFTIIHAGFVTMRQELAQKGVEKIAGVLFDFGLSSPQLDNASRGFSFRLEAPLDMRMDNSQGLSAKEWLQTVEEEELAKVIRDFGEERYFKRVAHAIVSYRQQKPIETTKELVSVISKVVKVKERGLHPATRTFQAIRIKINQELKEIECVLPEVLDLLSPNGRLVSIAFHSLEDRIVKRFLQENSKPISLPKWVMMKESELGLSPLKILGHPVKASSEEVALNPRARSAIMRVAEK